MRFHLVRLVLFKREQGDIFDEWDGLLPDRETWLRRVFSREIEFIHRKVKFYYVPDPEPQGNILSGRIGRQRPHKENEPPEAGLKDTARLTWRAAIVVIDPTSHDDGQKVAMEASVEIGKPSAVLRSLASELNTNIPPEPYAMEATSIIDPATFWKFVEDNEGDITSVTFEMFAPNMFGVRNNLVILAITLASASQLHLTLNQIEERHMTKNVFLKTRANIRQGAYFLIAAFLLSVLLVTVKPHLATAAWSAALLNGAALLIVLWNSLVLLALTEAVFSLEPDL